MKNLLATVLLILVYLSSYSQSTFTAATNNNWNNANNWSPSGIPTSSTDVIIPSSVTCTIPSGYAAQCLSLTISGGTLTSVNTSSLTVTNNFDISSGTYNNQTLLNVSASSLTMSGGTMTLGLTTSNNAVAFPTISGTVTLSGGTVAYNANTSQIVSNYTYNNLTTGGTGNKSLSSNILVNSNLTLNNSATLNCTSFDLSVIGNISGAGAISFTSGNLTISGNNTQSGTFTSGTGTVTYNANTGTQTVAGKNYYNLTFTNAGTRSLSGTIGISNVYSPSGTITAGSSTITFNGGSQVIPVSTYNNLIVAGSNDKTLNGNVTIGGALTITTVTLNADANNISLTGALSGTGNLVFTSGNLDIRGSYTNTGTLTTGTGTVTYTGTSGTQTVKSTTYNILAKSGAGTASIGGSVIVTGDLQISAGTFAVNSNTLTVSGNITGSTGTLSSTSGTIFLAGNYTHSGSFTMGTGTFEYNGTSGSQTVAAKNYYNLTFSGASTKSLSGTIGVANTYSPSGSITYGTSTLAFNGTSQSIPAEPYYNLTLSGSGNKTPLADLSITNNLAITTIGLNAGAINVTVGLNITGTGSLTFTTGNLNVGGSFTNSGSFTAGTGTVTYNGNSGSQTVAGKSYYNLTFTNAASRTLSGTINISNVLTSSGTVSVGSSTVNFNGGAQNIPAFTFNNLTISGSGNKTLIGDVIVNRTLTFTSNSIITSSNSIRVLSTGSISGASNTSHVVGNLRMNFSSTSTSKTFPIGDGSNLLNVTITGTSISGTGYLQLSSTTVSEPVATSYPNISSSNFTDFTKLINRYWTIRNSSLTFSSIDVTTTFLNPTDLGSGNPVTSNLVAKGYSSATSSWVVLSTLSRTSSTVSTSNIRIPTNGNSFDFWLGEGSPSKCISNVTTGNWTSPSSWTGCASGFPTDIDTVVISSGNTITMDGNSGTAYQLLIDGTARWTSTNTTIVGAGGVQISSTGDITGATAGNLTIGGNLILDRPSLTSSTVILEFDNGSSQQITSSLSLPSYTIPQLRLSANVTNTLTSLTISNAFTGSSSFTLTQPATSTLTLTLSSSGTSVPTINASANGATVVYNRNGNQVLSPGTYYNLQLTNSGGTSKTTTLSSVVNVTNSLSLDVGSAASHSLTITSATNTLVGGGAASFALGTGTTLNLGATGSAVAVSLPTFTTFSFATGSTVAYNANSSSQAVNTSPTYSNLNIATGAATITKTLTGSTLTVGGNLTLNNGSGAITLDIASNTLNIGGNILGTGTLSTSSGNTINYNGTTGSQTILNIPYSNLFLSNSATKVLPSTTITVSGNFICSNVGTVTVTGNTINFNGTSSQTVTAPFTLNNIQFYNTNVSGITLGSNLSVLGSIDITSPILDNGGFTISGGTSFTLGSGSTLITSNTTSPMPSGFSTITLSSGSTVNYSANGGQTIDNTFNYHHLSLTGIGTKTVSGSGILYIAGDFNNSSALDATTNSTTVEFNGTSGSQSITGTNTFYNLNKSGAASINTISTMQTVNNLLTVASGSGQINSNGNITIIEGASLIDNNSSSSFPTGSSGYVVVQKTATGTNRSYFLSSPVSSFTATDLMAGQTAQVLGFDTDGTPLDINTTYRNTCAPALRQKGSFNGLYKSATGTLTVGRGYSVKQTTSKSISFLGNVNNGDISFPTLATVNRTIPDGSGFAWCSGPTGLAILGNPYPSSIDWNLVYANSSGLNTSAKIWNGINYTDVSSSDPVLANRAIKSGQGFMIQVLSTNIPGGSLTFNNSQRIGTNNGTLLRTESDNKTIKVQLSNKTNAEYNDVLNIRFNEEASDRYDEKFDSYDIKGIESVPSIVTVVDGNLLSTTELPLPTKTKILPLSLAITETSTYEIATTTESNIPEDFEVYLVDKTTKKEYDLSKPNLIKLESGEYDNYEIQLRKFDGNTETFSSPKDYNNVYVSENKVKIEYNKDYASDLAICDITGKVVFTKNNIINGTYEFELGKKNSSQFYIVKIVNSNDTNTYKIIVQ